jgi:hypothetical protein
MDLAPAVEHQLAPFVVGQAVQREVIVAQARLLVRCQSAAASFALPLPWTLSALAVQQVSPLAWS